MLDSSLALVVALLVDPTQVPPPAPPPPEVIIREVPVLVHEPWHLAIAIRAIGEWSTHVTGGGELAVIVTPPRLWDVELAAFWDRHVDITTDLAGRSVTERFAGGSVAVCPIAGMFAACGGVRIARLAWQGRGFDQDLEGSALVPALGADARVALPIAAWLDVVAGLGVRVPLRHVSFAYARSVSAGGGEIEVDHTQAISLALALGVVARAF